MLPKILLVEDDKTLGYALKTYLGMHQFLVSSCADGQEGKAKFEQDAFDLCILDVMMPNMDGFTLAEEIKRQKPEMPIIFLTAKSLKVDKLLGFQKGADDYIVKPVDEEELIARIQAVLKRTQPPQDQKSAFVIGKFQFDWEIRKLVSVDYTVVLSKKEADLLKLLCEQKNQLVNRQDILQKLWGKVDYFNRRSMDVHIAKLRKSLQDDPRVKIINVHGKGYILED